MVGLVLRYAPLYVDLRKAQKDGLLGDVASIEASEHIPPYHGAFFMRDWRRYDRYAGSFMLEKCCHDLDLYNGVMGCRPMRVASFGGRRSFTPKNAPQRQGVNDLEVYHRKPSGWLGSDKVFDSDGDIIDFQTAIVEYANGACDDLPHQSQRTRRFPSLRHHRRQGHGRGRFRAQLFPCDRRPQFGKADRQAVRAFRSLGSITAPTSRWCRTCWPT